jgi:preprotein translocase subunit SecG
MLRLAIILVAIAIGITLGIAMANRYWKKKTDQHIEADSEYVDAASETSLIKVMWPWVLIFTIVFIGLLLLTTGEKAEVSDRYHPAQFKDGQIMPHHFGDTNSQ